MKAALVIILSVVLVFFFVQIFSIYGRSDEASKKLDELEASLQKVAKDNQSLRSDYDYYKNPINLEKEVRARFNYRTSGEKMIIIVPNKTTSTNP